MKIGSTKDSIIFIRSHNINKSLNMLIHVGLLTVFAIIIRLINHNFIGSNTLNIVSIVLYLMSLSSMLTIAIFVSNLEKFFKNYLDQK